MSNRPHGSATLPRTGHHTCCPLRIQSPPFRPRGAGGPSIHSFTPLEVAGKLSRRASTQRPNQKLHSQGMGGQQITGMPSVFTILRHHHWSNPYATQRERWRPPLDSLIQTMLRTAVGVTLPLQGGIVTHVSAAQSTPRATHTWLPATVFAACTSSVRKGVNRHSIPKLPHIGAHVIKTTSQVPWR
jgi:hypothetical protein